MRRIVLLAMAWFASGAPATAQAPRPPIAAFGALPTYQQVEISPDGARLAVLVHTPGGENGVHLIDLSGASAAHTVLSNSKIRRIEWADSRRVMLMASKTVRLSLPDGVTSYLVTRWSSLDAGTKQVTPLLRDNDVSASTGYNVAAAGGSASSEVLVSLFEYDAGLDVYTDTRIRGQGSDREVFRLNLKVVDLATGRTRTAAQGTTATEAWYVGHGRAIARLDRQEGRYRLFRIDADGRAAPLSAYPFDEGQRPAVVLGPTGDELWSLVQRDGRPALAPLGADGAPRLASAMTVSDGEVVDYAKDFVSGRIIGLYLENAVDTVRWLDPALEAAHRRLSRAFAGKIVTLVSWTQARDKVVAFVESGSDPGTYYLLENGRASVVGERHVSLAGVTLGPRRDITYAARDGQTIHAYLTLPPAAEPKKLPLIVLPHGGPEAQDDPGFDWLAQAIATRGYAVLQPQFRGSTGRGAAFRDAGLGQWGKRMQDDISDGVRDVVADGVADPRRVCIVGASYGGYAALAGATLTPDLYACAVSIGGVADLAGFAGWVRKRYGQQSSAADYWRRQIGALSDGPALDAISPSRQAAAARAPILLLHGQDDTIVPILQSETMQVALTAAGKPVTLVRLQGDDHYLSLQSTRQAMLAEIERFLAAHLAAP